MELPNYIKKRYWKEFLPWGITLEIDIPENISLVDIFENGAEEFGDRISMNYYGREFTFKEMDLLTRRFTNALLNWHGNGTANDPYIIDSYENFPTELRIYQSTLYISIKNCNLKYFTMKKCKNIILENCAFKSLRLHKCVDIQIENCTLNQKLALINCHNLKIYDSTIPLLSFIRCFENHLKNCSLDQTNNHFSKGNIFEQIDTPISDFDTIFGMPTSIFYGQSLGFGIVGIITIIAAIYLAVNSSYNSSPDFLIWLVGGLLILGFGVLAGAIIMLIDKYKMKNYPPNKIL